MAVHKHRLTKGVDHLVGGAGVDIFLAPLGKRSGHTVPTLGNDDTLNGGEGLDRISASLAGKSLLPVLKNIETAIFSRAGQAGLKLDLSRATDLQTMTISEFHSNAKISHATNMDHISVAKSADIALKIGGIDTKAVNDLHLRFNQASGITFDLRHGGASFEALDIDLNHSEAHLIGASAAKAVSVHANGKASNTLLLDPGKLNDVIGKLSISGHSALDMLAGGKGGLHGLTEVDAASLTGNLHASFGGVALQSVVAGSGHDTLVITDLGGSVANRGEVDLGFGDDILNLRHLQIDTATMLFDAGNGHDTLQVEGAVPLDFNSAMISFETLELWNPQHEYHLDSGWTTLLFKTVTGINSDVRIIGGTALTRIVASDGDDQIRLEAIGGTAADKANLTMSGGDDILTITQIALDSASQFFDGGAGYDLAVVDGNVTNLATLFDRFEAIQIVDGTGTYDMQGTGFHTVWFVNATAGAITVDNLQNDAFVVFGGDQNGAVTINLADAAGSTTDKLKIDLASSTTAFGSSASGLFAAGLSNLTIRMDNVADTFYLSKLGAVGDAATLTVEGDHSMAVKAAAGADLFINAVVIKDKGGVDILHLIDGDSCFSTSGALINGGSGDDILIGGAGADHIAAGGGSNAIYGSLGNDTIELLAKSGPDTIIYTSKAQSGFTGGDEIFGFASADGIDIGGIVGSVGFGGNFTSQAAGLSSLSTSQTTAFFNQNSSTLFIDINHDGALTAGADMEIHITGLATFDAPQLFV